MILPGGRKHTVALASLVVLPLLALLDAPGEAFTALGIMTGCFFGAHAVQDHATAKNGAPK